MVVSNPPSATKETRTSKWDMLIRFVGISRINYVVLVENTVSST